jgi:hypothetical protein
MSRLWKCTLCHSIFKVQEGPAMAVFNAGGLLSGTVTCGTCGAKYIIQDIYAGKYDVPSEERYNLIIVVHDVEPVDRDAFLSLLFERFHVQNGDQIPCIVYQNTDARYQDKIFIQVTTLGMLTFRRDSLELDDGFTRFLPFELMEGKIRISGHLVMMRGKR